MSTTSPPNRDLVRVHVRGPVSDADRDRAVDLLAATFSVAPRPVLQARLELDLEPNPARERPAVVKAVVDASGQIVRAHVALPTMTAAVDETVARVRRGLVRLTERRETRRRRPASSGPGEWRHGDLPDAHPEYFPRPIGEREVVRHKSYTLTPMTPDEALFEMEMLAFDFHLYEDASTGADCVIALDADGEPKLIAAASAVGRGPAGEPCEVAVEHAPTLTQAQAQGVLDGAGARFVAFVDADSGREHVLYHRYDGHYGLLMPVDEDSAAAGGAT